MFTGVARGTVEQADAMRAMLELVYANAGTVLFVHLVCSRQELVKRVQSESRRARGKLADPDRLLREYDPSATLPFEPHLRLDTTHLPPRDAAAEIAAHYSLPLA